MRTEPIDIQCRDEEYISCDAAADGGLFFQVD